MRIQDLLDRIAVWGENDEIVGDIVNTSVKHHFVTPYTSLFLEIDTPQDFVERGIDHELADEDVPVPTSTVRNAPTPRPRTSRSPVIRVPGTIKGQSPPRPRQSTGGGFLSSLHSKMAGSIMGTSDEVSDTMRERILNDIKSKNEKVMLSIPTSIKMTRKERRRDISVVINNISPETKCFCVFPHLLGLDGPGSYSIMISKSTMSGSLSSGTDWTAVTDEDQLKKKLKRYTPQACWAGAGKCKPNNWFVGEAGIRADGEQANDVKVSLELPRDPLEAPDGRWAFTVEVCTYVPPTGAGCNACVPENCRQVPVDECQDAGDEDCYTWYDSAAFHVQVFSDDGSRGSSSGVRPHSSGKGAGRAPRDGAAGSTSGSGRHEAVLPPSPVRGAGPVPQDSAVAEGSTSPGNSSPGLSAGAFLALVGLAILRHQGGW